MNKKLSTKTQNIVCISFFILSMILQIILIPKLPKKYFYDSNAIIDIINNNYSIKYDSIYMFAGNVFKKINIFNFTDFYQWAYLITIVMSLITTIYLFKYKNLEIHKVLFLYVTMIFCNIYIYRISKDLIQLVFWGVMYIILSSKRNKKIKLLLIFSVFILESIYFRWYYIGTRNFIFSF